MHQLLKEESQATTLGNNLKYYSPKNMDVAFCQRINTALDAADSGAICLYGLRRTHGDDKVAALIKLHLVRLNIILDTKRPLTDEMIDFITDEIIARYSSMNMADVWLVLHRAAAGDFGELFESLNPPKILNWFAKYWDERLTACEQRSMQRGESMKETSAERSTASGTWNSSAFREFKIKNIIKTEQQ